MPDAPKLTPDELARLTVADHDDIRQSVAHGLRFDGRKRIRYAENSMADIAADHLVKHLQAGGYVIMKKPPTYDDSAHIPRVPLKD
jgi:hypothetical protein